MAHIGIFDSGCGGLSVLKEALRALPGEQYTYYSDNAYCPYGGKPADFIIERSKTICRELLERGAQIIVVACNTATGAAIEELRRDWPEIAFIGMEPAVKPAALLTRSGVIGVLATQSTLNAEKYKKTRDAFASELKVVERVGQGFVELVENGDTFSENARKVVSESLSPMLELGADVIVLGCTHYPFLLKQMKEIAGPEVKFIDPAPAVVRQLAKTLKEKQIALTNAPTAAIQTLSSGQKTALDRLLSLTLTAPKSDR